MSLDGKERSWMKTNDKRPETNHEQSTSNAAKRQANREKCEKRAQGI